MSVTKEDALDALNEIANLALSQGLSAAGSGYIQHLNRAVSTLENFIHCAPLVPADHEGDGMVQCKCGHEPYAPLCPSCFDEWMTQNKPQLVKLAEGYFQERRMRHDL